MNTFIVRPAQSDDVDTLVTLCAEHAQFERAGYDTEGKAVKLGEALFGAHPKVRAWIAIAHDKAVGYAAATEDFSTWHAVSFLHMDGLFVRQGHRNSGIGAALLSAVIQDARNRGLHEVQWQTPDWNADACRFYQRQGAAAQAKIRFRFPIW